MKMRWLRRLFGASGGADRARTESGDLDATDSPLSAWQLMDSEETLTAELERARRYEHAFSIVVVSQNPLPEYPNGTSNGTHGTSPSSANKALKMSMHVAAAGLREALRESDVLCYQPAHECFVLGLTESDQEAARLAVNRVRRLFSSRLHVHLAVGVAQFPDDSLTLGDLIETARARISPAVVPGVGVMTNGSGQ